MGGICIGGSGEGNCGGVKGFKKGNGGGGKAPPEPGAPSPGRREFALNCISLCSRG